MSFALRLRDRFHDARADLLIRLLAPRSGARLLDLGGGDGSFARRLRERADLEITVAEVHEGHRDRIEGQGFDFVLLNDDDRSLPFGDGEFDIVLANSVIEHVTLPKERCRVEMRVDQYEWERETRAAQTRFAEEVRRVGRSYFVQTPHRHFPIEQHLHLPFAQYLSHNSLCRLVTWTDRFWIKSCQGIVDWELLSSRDMERLFPGCRIFLERFLGLPKSIIAYRRAG